MAPNSAIRGRRMRQTSSTSTISLTSWLAFITIGFIVARTTESKHFVPSWKGGLEIMGSGSLRTKPVEDHQASGDPWDNLQDQTGRAKSAKHEEKEKARKAKEEKEEKERKEKKTKRGTS
eukprot:GHVN01084871.1.p1 GENE.GHVN01084871.1~~GHVN01084871.1.p1  ORF type:complete len:120 (+),score=22.33 GHVN01084871.1:224-583(+)